MWFVMLRHQKGFPMPMVEDADTNWQPVVLFDTEEEATNVARENFLGKHFGFEVYEWPYGML